MKKILILLITASVSGCNQKFDVGTQPNSAGELLKITDLLTPCKLNDQVNIFSVPQQDDNTYIVTVKYKENITPVRMYKSAFTMGGYTLEGVSPDGVFKVNSSVNYLSQKGMDVTVDSVEHYSDGIRFKELYQFCGK